MTSLNRYHSLLPLMQQIIDHEQHSCSAPVQYRASLQTSLQCCKRTNAELQHICSLLHLASDYI